MTDWKAERDEKFPKEIVLMAQHAQRATGCLASVTLAQWARESGFGKHCPGNNPFGIKAREGRVYPTGYGKRALKTWEHLDGKDVEVTAYFLTFPSLEEAFKYHGYLVVNPHTNSPYFPAYLHRRDWRKFVSVMGPIYATDPAYTEGIIDLIATHHLYDFDLAVNA